jgi:hypothetical protein
VQQGDSRSQAILEHEDQDRDLCKRSQSSVGRW